MLTWKLQSCKQFKHLPLIIKSNFQQISSYTEMVLVTLNAIKSCQKRLLSFRTLLIQRTTNLTWDLKSQLSLSTNESPKDSLYKIRKVVWKTHQAAASLTNTWLKVTQMIVKNLTFSWRQLPQIKDVCFQLTSLFVRMTQAWKSLSCSIWRLRCVTFISIGQVQSKYLRHASTLIRLLSSSWTLERTRISIRSWRKKP